MILKSHNQCFIVYSDKVYTRSAEFHCIRCFGTTITTACESALLVIIGVAICLWACLFKYTSVREIGTSLRVIVIASATVSISIERQSSALASDDLTISSVDFHLFSRALNI